MSIKDPKESVKQIEGLVGRPETRRLLCVEGVSPHTANKLVRNKYAPEIQSLLAGAIERALEAAKRKASA